MRWIEGVLREKYIVKMRGVIGPERNDMKVIDVLGRTIEWKDKELWYEADPRQVDNIFKDMG